MPFYKTSLDIFKTFDAYSAYQLLDLIMCRHFIPEDTLFVHDLDQMTCVN